MRRHIGRMNGHKLAFVLIAAFALFVGAFLIRARQTAQADLHICRAQQQERAVLRSILVLARARSRDSEAFYREALRLAKPIDCQALPSLNPLP